MKAAIKHDGAKTQAGLFWITCVYNYQDHHVFVEAPQWHLCGTPNFVDIQGFFLSPRLRSDRQGLHMT